MPNDSADNAQDEFNRTCLLMSMVLDRLSLLVNDLSERYYKEADQSAVYFRPLADGLKHAQVHLEAATHCLSGPVPAYFLNYIARPYTERSIQMCWASVVANGWNRYNAHWERENESWFSNAIKLTETLGGDSSNLKSNQPHGPQTKLNGQSPMPGRSLQTLLTELLAEIDTAKKMTITVDHLYHMLFSNNHAVLHGQTDLSTSFFFNEASTISILESEAGKLFQLPTGYLIEAVCQTLGWEQEPYLSRLPRVKSLKPKE